EARRSRPVAVAQRTLNRAARRAERRLWCPDRRRFVLRQVPARIAAAERAGHLATETASVRLARSYRQAALATVRPLTVTAAGAATPTKRACHERLAGAPGKVPRAGTICSDEHP